MDRNRDGQTAKDTTVGEETKAPGRPRCGVASSAGWVGTRLDAVPVRAGAPTVVRPTRHSGPLPARFAAATSVSRLVPSRHHASLAAESDGGPRSPHRQHGSRIFQPTAGHKGSRARYQRILRAYQGRMDPQPSRGISGRGSSRSAAARTPRLLLSIALPQHAGTPEARRKVWHGCEDVVARDTRLSRGLAPSTIRIS